MLRANFPLGTFICSKYSNVHLLEFKKKNPLLSFTGFVPLVTITIALIVIH